MDSGMVGMPSRRLKRRTRKTSNAVVHLLVRGNALCGFSRMRPEDWPDGHLWVRRKQSHIVTCAGCQRLIAEHELM